MNKGCLLIHGFTGAPYEVLPLAEYLKKQGYQVEVPTLTGHGGNLRDLRHGDYRLWLADAERAYGHLKEHCEQVIVVGFSMGGLLAINIACKYNIAGLVTLSAPIYVWDWKQMAKNLAYALHLKEYGRVKEYISRASGTPGKATLNFLQLLHLTKRLIPQVTVPTLIIQGKRDDTVKAKSADYIFRTIVSADKRISYLPESSHLVCLGPEKEQVFRLVSEFIRSLE